MGEALQESVLSGVKQRHVSRSLGTLTRPTQKGWSGPEGLGEKVGSQTGEVKRNGLEEG